MQEAIQKRKENLKLYRPKRTKKPIFKPKDKNTESKTRGTPKTPVKRKPKRKARFIAPKTGTPQKIEIKPAALPIFRSKKSTVKSVRTEQEIKLISTEISVKREAKERLKGSIEELLSDPQQLTNLSSVLKEFEKKISVKTNFDSSIPSERSPVVKEKIKVPAIKSENFTPTVSKTGFDTSLPEIIIEKRVVTAPEITVTKLPEVTTKTRFDEEVSSQVVSKIIGFQELENEEEANEETVEAVVEGEIVISEIAEDEVGGKESEQLDFLKILIGKGAGRISERKPICIIVQKSKDEYEKLITILCRDVYREKSKQGMPIPVFRDNIEELKNELEILAQGKTLVVKEVKTVSKQLVQILEQFSSQGMGFLILVSTNPQKLEEEIRGRGELSAKIITVNVQPELEMMRNELLRIIRGKESIGEAESFGEEFKKSSESFEDELIEKYFNHDKAPEQLRNDWDKLVVSSPNGDEDASKLHSAMKAFVWLYEWKKHGKKIIPELEAEEGEDVKIEDKNYEIETMFGVGDVGGKIIGKIKKYQNRKGEKIYFVIRNMDILRNLSLLSTIKSDWRKKGYTVEFFGLDLDKQELVPLKAFVKVLKSRETKEG
jgi:hypothetical protein